MEIPKRKKEHDDEELDDKRPVRFEALAELTSSDVVAQLKAGMGRIAPLEADDSFDDSAPY